MAVTVERLIATLEARIDKYEKNLQKAYGQTDRQFTRIERRGKQMESRLAKIGAGGFFANFGAGFLGGIASGFSVKAAQQLVDSATRIQNSLKVVGLSGSDLTKVYDRLFASAQKNAAPFEALATLYGRAAQQQKELGVSTDQLLQFTDNVSIALRVAGTDAGTASGALLQLGQALGSGTVHAEEFNSILEGVPTIAQTAAAGIKEAGGSVAALKQLVVDGKVSSKAFFDGFAAGAETLKDRVSNSEVTVSGALVRVQNVLIDVAGRFDDSTHATRILANAINTTLIPAIEELGSIANWVVDGPVGKLYNAISATVDKIVQLSADYGAMTGLDKLGGNPYIGPGRIQDRIDGAFAGANYTTPKDDRKSTEITVNNGTPVKPITLSDYPITGGGGKGKTGGRGARRLSADDRIKEDIQNVKDRTAALKAETEMVGLSYEEQQRRSMALDLEQEALKRLREEAARKGQKDLDAIKLSPDQVVAIDAASEAYARQADILRKVQENQRDAEQAAGEFYDTFKGGIIDAITGAEDFKDALSDVLKKLGDLLLNAAFDSLFAPASGSSSGGSFGNIFGAIGKFITGSFANGTMSAPGGPALINENGGEIVDLPKGSRVYPHDISMKMAKTGNASGAQIAYSPTYNFSGTSQELADFRRETARDKAEFSARVIKTVRQAQSSRMLG